MPSSTWVATTTPGTATATPTDLATGASVSTLNDDDILSRAKKPQLIKDYNAELQEQTQLDAQGTALGVSTASYDSGVAALTSFLQGLGGVGPAWNFLDVTTDTSMGAGGGATLRNDWNTVAARRALLQKALTDKIQGNAAYADALARSSNNLIKNGNSEDLGATGFDAAGATSVGIPHTGTRCRQLLGDPSLPTNLQITDKIWCNPSEQYYLQVWTRMYAAVTGYGGTLVARVYNASGTVVQYAFLPPETTTNYSLKNTSFTVDPAGAYFIVSLYTEGAAGGGIGAGNAVYADELYLTKKITAGMIQGDAIQTSNYAETAGNPTAGARMDISGSALKVYRDGLQIGATVFSEYLLGRIVQGMDGSTAGGRIFYRGSIDSTTLGGAPNIGCLAVTRQDWSATYNLVRLDLKLQPSAPADNLDAMRYAKIVLYRQSALGTTATLSGGYTYYRPLPDRLYANAGTDSSASNATFCTFDTVSGVAASGAPACLVTLFNVYGGSATNCFYSSSSGANGVDLVNNGTAWPAGITGGTGGGAAGGGGSAGGACPAPWVKILLASGLLVDAGDLYNGAVLAGVNDGTLEPMTGVVSGVSIEFEMRVPIILTDGRVTEFSLLHRMAVEGRGWVAVKDLQAGDSIVAQRPSIVKGLGVPALAQVVKFQVDGCHTYFGDDLLSHNMKALP